MLVEYYGLIAVDQDLVPQANLRASCAIECHTEWGQSLGATGVYPISGGRSSGLRLHMKLHMADSGNNFLLIAPEVKTMNLRIESKPYSLKESGIAEESRAAPVA